MARSSLGKVTHAFVEPGCAQAILVNCHRHVHGGRGSVRAGTGCRLERPMLRQLRRERKSAKGGAADVNSGACSASWVRSSAKRFST